MKILIFGGKGYIAGRCKDVWADEAILSDAKIESTTDAISEIEKHQPDVVLNAAGVRGRPNVDWCELPENKLYTAFGNAVLPTLIAKACSEAGVYLLHIGSGCVFYGDSPDPKGWKEGDFANPESFYSKQKYAADLQLNGLPNVGIARIRVPLDDRPYPGNILDKLLAYEKVFDVQNSLTIIPDMIETFYQIIQKRGEGIFHVTNPGAIHYRRIIEYFQELLDPKINKVFVTPDQALEQGLVVKTRSTNLMQSTRLEELGIPMRPVSEAVDEAIKNWAKLKKSV